MLKTHVFGEESHGLVVEMINLPLTASVEATAVGAVVPAVVHVIMGALPEGAVKNPTGQLTVIAFAVAAVYAVIRVKLTVTTDSL